MMESRPIVGLTGFRECLTLRIVVSVAYDGEGPQKAAGLLTMAAERSRQSRKLGYYLWLSQYCDDRSRRRVRC